MDARRFGKGIKLLTSTLRVELDDDATEGYRLGLEDLTDDEFTFAIRTALRTCKGGHLPSPGELRGMAGKGGPQDLKAKAARAWEAVRGAMDKHDYTDSVDFGDHTNAVVRNLGGWIALCHEDLRSLVFTRKRFEELWVQYAESPPQDERAGRPLVGCFGITKACARIAIDGSLPPERARELPAQQSAEMRKLVGDMANAKRVT